MPAGIAPGYSVRPRMNRAVARSPSVPVPKTTYASFSRNGLTDS